MILSLQLSFAVIPLIHFTSNRRNMGAFATPWWGQVLAWVTAAIIVALNGKLVLDQVADVGRAGAASRAWASGPLPLSWLVGAALVAVTGERRGAAGLGDDQAAGPAVARLGSARERPARLGRGAPAPAAGADRRGPGARPGRRRDPQPGPQPGPGRRGQTELVLLHVVDTPMTRVYGAETADRETGADARYLAELVAVAAASAAIRARSVLLHGPDPAGQLVGYCGTSRSTCWSSARTATAWCATCSSARPWTRSATASRSRC